MAAQRMRNSILEAWEVAVILNDEVVCANRANAGAERRGAFHDRARNTRGNQRRGRLRYAGTRRRRTIREGLARVHHDFAMDQGREGVGRGSGSAADLAYQVRASLRLTGTPSP